MEKYPNPQHSRVVKMFGFCLTLADTDTWLGAIDVFRARLNQSELTSLAYISLKALSLDNAHLCAQSVLGGGSAGPLPTFISPIEDANDWADMAEPAELDAYCLACFRAMDRDRQAAFLTHIQGPDA